MSRTLSSAAFNTANRTAADFPQGIIAGSQAGDFTLYDGSDLFAAAIPAALGTTLLAGPITLDARFLSVHMGSSDSGRVRNVLNRSHDQVPGGRWSVANPSPGVFVDAGIGAWLQGTRDTGGETIYTVFHTPTWASARPAEGGDPYGSPGSIAEPANMANLQAFVTWLMTTYGHLIDYLEVWNEPKYSAAIAGSYFSGTPAKLAEMARVIAQAAKAVKPSIPILGVGCTGVALQAWAPGDLSGLDYTNKFLTASDGAAGTGADWIDVLTVHTYEHTGVNDITKLQYLGGNLEGIMDGAGIAGWPVWATEFGYITPPFANYQGPKAGRMRLLARYALYHAVAGISRAMLYSYSSNLGWGGDAESNAAWEAWCDLLNGAEITRINRIGNTGALAAVINGVNVLV